MLAMRSKASIPPGRLLLRGHPKRKRPRQHFTVLRLRFGAAIISPCADVIDSRGENSWWKSTSKVPRKKKTGVPAITLPLPSQWQRFGKKARAEFRSEERR